MKRFIFMLLAVVFTMGGTLTAFAMDYPSNLPELPKNDYSVYNYIFKDNDRYILHSLCVFEEEYKSMIGVRYVPNPNYENSGAIYISTGRTEASDAYAEVYNESFELVDGAWQRITTQSFIDETLVHNGYVEFVYTDIDIKDNSGNVVFPVPPVPLAEEIRGVAEEVLTVETMPELTRTVLVVVLCGVGCLALAISLPLLKRVFSQFRV